MLDELNANVARPPKIKRLLIVAGVCLLFALIFCLIIYFIDMEANSKGLRIILWLLALVPIGLSVLMVAATAFGYYTLYTRNESIRVTLEIKNRDIFEAYGVKCMPAENFDWLVAEIKNKKSSPRLM